MLFSCQGSTAIVVLCRRAFRSFYLCVIGACNPVHVDNFHVFSAVLPSFIVVRCASCSAVTCACCMRSPCAWLNASGRSHTIAPLRWAKYCLGYIYSYHVTAHVCARNSRLTAFSIASHGLICVLCRAIIARSCAVHPDKTKTGLVRPPFCGDVKGCPFRIHPCSLQRRFNLLDLVAQFAIGWMAAQTCLA